MSERDLDEWIYEALHDRIRGRIGRQNVRPKSQRVDVLPIVHGFFARLFVFERVAQVDCELADVDKTVLETRHGVKLDHLHHAVDQKAKCGQCLSSDFFRVAHIAQIHILQDLFTQVRIGQGYLAQAEEGVDATW